MDDNELELLYAYAKKDFDTFFRITVPGEDYRYGKHTHKLIDICQDCTEAIERGETKYVIFNIAPRHGKSDIVSRRYPVWHLGDHPNHEVILASYASELATELSGNAKDCFKQCVDALMFWELKLSGDTHKKNSWGIAGKKGLMNAVGLGGSVTGKGAHLLIIDDYCKNREEAESLAKRDRAWEAFRNDLLTRLSPDGHAVVIAATRWHEDDLVGRILEEMKNNPEFPRFEVISMPAQNEDGSYLFPERFSPEMYLAFKALVGSYGWQSLYLQDPKPRTGNMLRVDLTHVINVEDLPAGLEWCRSWDLASSEKERAKTDPDWTVGTESAYDKPNNRIYVRDVVRGQWTALTRDRRIKEVGLSDRANGTTTTYVESVAGYKDAYVRIKKDLAGIQKVVKVTPKGDKVARASVTIEAPFEAAKVYIVRAEWNGVWLDEFAVFPKGKHDDMVDSLVNGVYNKMKHGENLITSILFGGM